jgi:hypothetical protein
VSLEFLSRTPEALAFERALERHLSNRFPVARANENASFAPFMRAYEEKLTLPDFFCLPRANAYPFFVEAKFKTGAPIMEIWGDVRTTGIDLHKAQTYQKVERVTGCTVFLMFGHKSENEIRIGRMHNWTPGIGEFGKRMAWWLYDNLEVYDMASYTEMLDGPEPSSRLSYNEFWSEAGRRPIPEQLPGLEG